MMKLSDLRSSKNKIEMSVEIDEIEFDSGLPKNTDLDPAESKYRFAIGIILEYRNLIHDSEMDRDLLLKKRKYLLLNLRNSVIDIREGLIEINNTLSQPCLPSVFEGILDRAEPFLENLQFERLEIESLTYIGKTLKDAYEAFREKAIKRIDVYSQLRALIKKPMQGVLVFEDDKNFVFHVTRFGFVHSPDQNTQIAHWKELLDGIILRGIQRQVLASMDIRDNFMNEMSQLFKPIATFEDVLTIGEFLRARGEVMNFWSENFTYTEGFNYHFFKSLGFFESFKQNFLGKIDSVHSKVLARFNLFRKNDPSITMDAIVNVNLKQFLEKPFLVSDLSLSPDDEMQYFYANMMDSSKSHKFLKLTASNFAKKLNGILLDDRTIVRAVSKGSYRTEVVVIAFNHDKGPASLHVTRKLKELFQVKTEEYSDRITSENGKICFDADYTISYLLSTTDIKQVA